MLENVFKMGREVLLFWHMTLLKNSLDVSISSPFKIPQTTGVHVNVPNILVHEKLLKSSISFVSKTFLVDGAFGLLYSIGRGAERAHRLYQYFERAGER